jgi:hypothetical protein
VISALSLSSPNFFKRSSTAGKTEEDIAQLLAKIKKKQSDIETTYDAYIKALTEALVEDGRVYQL